VFNGLSRYADSARIVPIETQADVFRERALALASELELDPSAWYLQVLDETRSGRVEPDLGALVRAFWELQRVTGRPDLRDDWRRLADALWNTDTASVLHG